MKIRRIVDYGASVPLLGTDGGTGYYKHGSCSGDANTALGAKI
jgi:hypothetical protein